jgi:hypothetical protein
MSRLQSRRWMLRLNHGQPRQSELGAAKWIDRDRLCVKDPALVLARTWARA